MDYSLEVTKRKESLLQSLRALQVKAEGALQHAVPLLSLQRGMGMVTPEEVQQLSQAVAGMCLRVDDLGNRLRLRLNRGLGRLDGAGAAPGLHVAADGTVYVSSCEAPQISIVRPSGGLQRALDCTAADGPFLPEDVALTRAGMVATADLAGRKVRVFSPHSRFGQGEWVALGDFSSPRGVGVDGFGRLLVADYAPGKVHVFGVDSALRMQSVRTLSGLLGPRYVCGTPDGGLAVSEESGDVRVYGPSHKLLHRLGHKHGHRFGNPAGVCADPDGSILVVDQQERKVVLFPPSGSPVEVVTEGLSCPTAIACCPRGQIYVTDAAEACVKLFRYRHERHSLRRDPSPLSSPETKRADSTMTGWGLNSRAEPMLTEGVCVPKYHNGQPIKVDPFPFLCC